METFNDVFIDCTSQGTKIPKEKYLSEGKNIVIDQGQNIIAGYTDLEDGLFKDVPAIIFGDHTRIVKYVDRPFFLGADGVKLLKSKKKDANYKYLYYVLKNANIPDTGYNRHFKWLKEVKIEYPNAERQDEIVTVLDSISRIMTDREKELVELDNLIKARFVEMFGDPIHNERVWETLPVEKICKEIFGGGTPSKSHPEYYENGNIPWVSSKDMKYNVITDSQIHINRCGVDNSTARIVPINSVIMVIRSGILKHTLPVAINAVPITVNQDLKVFIPNKKVLARFMAIQFKMQESDILSRVRAVTADNIEFNTLKQRGMIVPPIELQKEYVSFLEQVDKSKFTYAKGL